MANIVTSSNTAKAAITKAYLGKDKVANVDNPLVYSVSQTVNLLPLLAYQKIYYDFFSESQWEKHLAYSYNVDYWDGKSQLNLAPEMLQLRYVNYPKDSFMGMLPSSQYGSVAVLSSTDVTLSPYRIVPNGSSSVYLKSDGNDSSSVSLSSSQSSSNALVVNADLSALS